MSYLSGMEDGPEASMGDWRRDVLPGLIRDLARRPGHEAVRSLLTEIIGNAFGARYVDHEVRLPEVRGRADTLVGTTVFEYKQDLAREAADSEAQLRDYLAESERRTGRRSIGIATDGAAYVAWELRDGRLTLLNRLDLKPDDPPERLLHWLEPAVSAHDDIVPDPVVIERELGRTSIVYARARGDLAALWSTLHDDPDVLLKRQLWDGLLREAYGAPVGTDALFLQHTYLTIVAKTIAARTLDLDVDDADGILSGRALADAGIVAVESDFFDWVPRAPGGIELVRRLARQTARFRLREVRVDVLKALYESLVDPAQRRDLGEYYTPDWLAAKVTEAAAPAPLTQRVLDPACGSGTFLFHAVRRVLAAARAEGRSVADAVAVCADNVRGLDIHPVAVIIARVTWLLALGEAAGERRGTLYVPVYLGDAMQWNVRQIDQARDVVVPVPGSKPLSVPGGFAETQQAFDPALNVLTDSLREGADRARVETRLRRIAGPAAADVTALGDTYVLLRDLYREGRDGIWPFVLRNLVRPLWLSRPEQRADVVLGNPPWVAYRYLSPELKTRLREACQAMDLWVGGSLATQQDLSALFWARSAQRYLRDGGTIAFVMPYAALNRPAFAGLRRGKFRFVVQTRVIEAWSFDERVRPLFPVPACVLIARREEAGALPKRVRRYRGDLPRRDATEPEADRVLRRAWEAWPPIPTLRGVSPYRERFTNGATIYPRRFFVVERLYSGRAGPFRPAPLLIGRVSRQDKAPWSSIDPPKGPVEAEFIRPLLLGETIAPFRVLRPVEAVIPVEDGRVLSSTAAFDLGHSRLGNWLQYAEQMWGRNSSKSLDGSPRMTLVQQVDHMRKLSIQFPTKPLRIVYSKAGALPAAALLNDASTVVDHKAYWAAANSIEEAHYVCAIVNSETVRRRITRMQSKGQGGARDFDNLMWELPIPAYDDADPRHRVLAEAGEHAARVAEAVALPEGHFTRQRRAIRDALADDGIAARIDALVAALIGP